MVAYTLCKFFIVENGRSQRCNRKNHHASLLRLKDHWSNPQRRKQTIGKKLTPKVLREMSTPSSPSSIKQSGPKRSKTFTGCFTCRTRKIKCDLKRPHCDKCIKAKLTCAGYDVKLRWSKPIQFVPLKNGDVKGTSVKFPTYEDGDGSDENELDAGIDAPEYFHRRFVEFVKWEEPYTTYDQMNYDLAYLQNNRVTSRLKARGDTRMKGPFGVFQGKIGNRDEDESGTTQKSKKRKIMSDKRNDILPEEQFITSSRSSNKSSDVAMISGDAPPQDQFWLSNELKDAALVTAAALNTHFLDIMNNFDNNGNVLPQSNNQGNNTTNDANYNLNNPDLFNLVFHNRGQNFNTVQPQTSNSNSNMSMSNLLNQPENLVDPIYYSNFSNFFYNNPYQMNENLEIQLHAQTTSADDTEYVDGDHSNDSKLLASIMKIVQSPLNVNFDLTLPTRQSHVGIPLTALQVQPLTRYLLNYYVTDVADLMTVIPLTENPWKAIYFPRALMAIGELSALGKTSMAKNALLNALLAVSAFNLQSKFPKNSQPMRFYLNLGIALRNQASLFVKKLLNSKNDVQSGIEHCVTQEKYKDVLCAVMTMISVDLVWGTMQDTGLYIAWCGKVIVAKMATKKKLSPKARILHRIFSSLKLIQDSTCLNFESIKENYESSTGIGGYDVNGDKFGNEREKSKDSNKGRIDFIVNNSFSNKTSNSNSNGNSTTSPQFVNKKLINTKKNDENFATDALYGLPNSLILLFSETVELLRIRIYYTTSKKLFPSDYEGRVKTLNEKLNTWVLDWKLYKGQAMDPNRKQTTEDKATTPSANPDGDDDLRKDFYSPMHEVTYHHIMSFYHALVIYFSRFIKDTPPTKLQTRVVKTLNHLNSIQDLIAKDEAAIIPLFWQGFIAGCEALSTDLQMGFKKWGADIAQYLGSYWGARQIMLEVWRRKSLKESRDDWVSVVQDWEMNLMLN
ncbi:Arg81 transcription factor [Candida orthopsilosis Co 90-125]|uniref:Arg81 transcription factor n=1 Tax=Candida orthopsilosis (strain 90-125) TaxID=1136231 RepID=H8X9X5_CANO9|nr:Arg81 transcription factor [Candida orthopsilosis Co 90-125]CCG24792.1 Arg81 transcription factor [Candida orthopsilosis Co 90-125]